MLQIIMKIVQTINNKKYVVFSILIKE